MTKEAPPEKIWTQLYGPARGKGQGLTTISAYDRDPREVYDNGQPVYEYALVRPAVPPNSQEAIQVILSALQQIKDGTEGNRGRCIDCEGAHITADDALLAYKKIGPVSAVPNEERDLEDRIVNAVHQLTILTEGVTSEFDEAFRKFLRAEVLTVSAIRTERDRIKRAVEARLSGEIFGVADVLAIVDATAERQEANDPG